MASLRDALISIYLLDPDEVVDALHSRLHCDNYENGYTSPLSRLFVANLVMGMSNARSLVTYQPGGRMTHK